MSSRRKRKDVKFLTVKDKPVHYVFFFFFKWMMVDIRNGGVWSPLDTFKRVVHSFISKMPHFKNTVLQKFCPLQLFKLWIEMLDVNSKMWKRGRFLKIPLGDTEGKKSEAISLSASRGSPVHVNIHGFG